MKSLIKGLGILLGLLLVLAGCGVTYVMLALPRVAPADQNLKIESTPARVKRGDYLAHHVMACAGCHSVRDWTIYGHPVKPGEEFAGGEPLFDRRIGMPGVIPPKNLTPYN